MRLEGCRSSLLVCVFMRAALHGGWQAGAALFVHLACNAA